MGPTTHNQTSNSDLALLYTDKTQAKQKHQDRVSIVIVTFNKYAYVRDLLLSLRQINYDRDLLDVIVVDNASVDGTEDKLREEFGAEITLIQTGANLGGAGGFNTGMRYAMERLTNEYIWLLDNDVVVQRDALNNLLDTLKANERAAAVGSMILQLDDPERINEIGASIDWRGGKTSLRHHGELYKDVSDKSERVVEYCAACSLLKRRSALEKIGYWEELFIHFDDVDWCLRAAKRGYDLMCNPRSIVFHESMNQKQPTWIKYYNVRNLLHLYATFKPLMFPLCLMKFSSWYFYFLLHGYARNAGLVSKAIRDFFAGKRKQQNFPLEKFQPAQDFDFGVLDEGAVLVFKDAQNVLDFAELASYKSPAKIFVYQDEGRDALQEKFPEAKICKPGLGQLLSTMLSGKQVVMDGAFEGFMMLPTFSSKLVVYTKFGTVVDLL